MTDRVYTRTGDAGETGLFGGGRVSKADARVEAYGAIDELNAAIGCTLMAVRDARVRDRLGAIQHDLFVIGAHLATPSKPGRKKPELPPLPVGRTAEIEQWIDEADAALPALRAFIIPGGSTGGAALHFARTICRRAERHVVALAAQAPVDPEILALLNRLSDYLFMAARLENQRAGSDEQRWEPRASGP
jgi:cob(I)alamin adenosyltransferase